ncbi:MAG: DNA polymerase IV [Promethearchaeota archaeon]|nr:MAG: DNA polymerase IV [Candidatus Lokiarchaeota archaeon]
MPRFVLHADLDCFFASVEMRDNPELKGKPVIIGADPKGGEGRGVISTCSYEAREYGLHSAMPISKAYKLCPHGIYLRVDGKKYSKVSDEVMEILESFADKFQKVSVDEAYLDVSESCINFDEVKQLAYTIKEEIKRCLGITCSIGGSNSKSIAKIASDQNKPDGICIVKPNDIKEFLSPMKITRIPGIGKKTKNPYYKQGIRNIGDLYDFPLYKMMNLFGKHSKWVWKVINGLDKRKVKEGHKGRKSISKERTFYKDTNNQQQIVSTIEKLNIILHKKLIQKNIAYRTITLKIRFENFRTYTRSYSLDYPICDQNKALEIIVDLYEEFSKMFKKVRLIGVKFSNFERTPKILQTNLMMFVNC